MNMKRQLRVKTKKPCDYKKWVLDFELWAVPQAIYIIMGYEPPELKDILHYSRIEIDDDDSSWKRDGIYTRDKILGIGKWDEYDYILDRLRSSLASHKLKGYKREGVEYVVPIHLLVWAAQTKITLPEELSRLLFFNSLRLDLDQVEAIVSHSQTLQSRNAELEKEVAEAKGESTKVKERNERTYLNIIGILLSFINGEFPNVSKHPDFISQGKLIKKIQVKYQGIPGLSPRTLEERFSEARKSLNGPD